MSLQTTQNPRKYHQINLMEQVSSQEDKENIHPDFLCHSSTFANKPKKSQVANSDSRKLPNPSTSSGPSASAAIGKGRKPLQDITSTFIHEQLLRQMVRQQEESDSDSDFDSDDGTIGTFGVSMTPCVKPTTTVVKNASVPTRGNHMRVR
mmetsp:Transcript_52417/g.59921  ORF Transcript_52417/g.59921 Transcript_52417/m.59921 type:complete len:150 (-) Transcript_52417:516-965(-)